MQAAALVIAKPLAGAAGFSDRAVDLRVDDHRTPIPELRRVYNVLRSNQILTEVMVAFRDSRPDDALRIVLTARDLSPENDNVWWASPIFTWRWAARANASTPYARLSSRTQRTSRSCRATRHSSRFGAIQSSQRFSIRPIWQQQAFNR